MRNAVALFVFALPLVVVLTASAGCNNSAPPPPPAEQAAQEPPLAQPSPGGKSVTADESR